MLRRLTEDPERPYAVVLGGAKVSDKLGVIDNLLGTADRLLIGGGMVFTFLAAQGHEVGKSLLEADQVDTVKGYLEPRREGGRRDRAARRRRRPPTRSRADADARGRRGRRDPRRPDGPRHRARVRARSSPSKLADCRTVFWNGPMGAFEMEPVSPPAPARSPQALVDVTAKGALTVVGGGDSAAAVRQLGFARRPVRPHLHRWRRAASSTSRARSCPASTVLEEGDD